MVFFIFGVKVESVLLKLNAADACFALRGGTESLEKVNGSLQEITMFCHWKL